MSQPTYDEPDDGIDPRIPEDLLTEDELAARRERGRNFDRGARRIESAAIKAEREAREAAERERDQAKREIALRDAREKLSAEGPLGTFLKHYEGDPTPDAIRKAIAEDPEWSGLITIPPDPVDVAVAEQTRNAQLMAGSAAPQLGELSHESMRGWPQDRKAQFRKEHPDEWSRLLKGEKVSAPVGFA